MSEPIYRNINISDYPGTPGAELDRFAILNVGKEVLLHVCLMETKVQLHRLMHKISGDLPLPDDEAMCFYREIDCHPLPCNSIMIVFHKSQCVPNIIYHECMHASLFISRFVPLDCKGKVSLLRVIQDFTLRCLHGQIRFWMPPNIDDRDYSVVYPIPSKNPPAAIRKSFCWTPVDPEDTYIMVCVFESDESLLHAVTQTDSRTPESSIFDEEVHVTRIETKDLFGDLLIRPHTILLRFSQEGFCSGSVLRASAYVALLSFEGVLPEHDEGIATIYDRMTMILGGHLREFL